MKQKPVKWLRPVVVKNMVSWPEKCEATIVTPQSVAWHQARGTGLNCKLAAKIDFRGKKLCTKHASIKALEELAGPTPVEEINAAR